MALVQSILFFFIPIVLILGLVVTVHELGHFLAAKALGTKIDRFSIGFGRAIFHRTDRSGVEWRVGWLPIGGYVRFAGDENAASVPDSEDLADMKRQLIAEGRGRELDQYFHFKPIWQRAIIVAAGPVSNFLLAIAIFATLLMTVGEPVGSGRVDRVDRNSAAEAAGIQPGDIIRKLNGKRVETFGDISQKVMLSSGTPLTLEIERGGRTLQVVATPMRGPRKDALGKVHMVGTLGMTQDARRADMVIRRYSLPDALARGVDRTGETITSTVTYIGRMFAGRETADQLAGPLGMAQMSGDIAKKSIELSDSAGAAVLNVALNLVSLAAVLSVGIGFMNLLPVPVLDGGHLLFYAYEAVVRRPLAAKVQAAGYRVGLALVLGLMLFATWNDLQRLRVFSLFDRLFS